MIKTDRQAKLTSSDSILIEESCQRTRNYYWDNIKGLLILLVVFAHVLYQLQDESVGINYTVDVIYLFHMPAFVFVSGFFAKA